MRVLLLSSFLWTTLLDTAASFTTITAPHHVASVRPSCALSMSKTALEQAEELRAQAEQMRLEADKMDAALTLNKIETLEQRLNNRKWMDKHKDEEPELLKQLQSLNQKMTGEEPVPTTTTTTLTTTGQGYDLLPTVGVDVNSSVGKTTVEAQSPSYNKQAFEDVESSSTVIMMADKDDEARLKANPMTGFDEVDLDLYLPVALQIEAEMPDATTEEHLAEFRSNPKLQEHFQKKIQELLASPMEDMQEMENLRQEYLASSSSVEKDTIKRQIERLETQIENPYEVSKSFYRATKQMSQEELSQRIENLEKLPSLLQHLFMRRNGILEEMDLELGILLEHHDEQLQLLDQVRYVTPLPDNDRRDSIKGFNSLPDKVRAYFVKSLGLEPGVSGDEVVDALGNGGAFVSSTPIRITESKGGAFEDLPEYNDIEFIERSQFVEELIPQITYLEKVRPTKEEIDQFVSKILVSKIFKLRSKPERIFGGYFVRGFNAINDEDANNKLVDRLKARLEESDLAGRLQFFFVPDPKAPTDEEIDMGVEEEPVLVVTGIDPKLMYRQPRFLTKAGITVSGLLSLAIFSLGTTELNDVTMTNIDVAVQAENVDEILRLTSNAVPVGLSIGATILAHEVAHRIVAWKDEVGLPNVIPSITLGVTGTIAPLESPPKNFKSLFDFAIAGPLAGYLVSFCLLVVGLYETAGVDFSQQGLLPALPAAVLRSSAVGGSLVEFFLGNGALSNQMTSDMSVLPLHPFAVAGYIGLVTNSLALLPIGHTDGGRIALSMFGRRGTYLISTGATLALCAVGLFGFDEARLLVTYLFFACLWQRELEAPMQNEVDRLDDIRSLFGFVTWLGVTLTLLPMPY